MSVGWLGTGRMGQAMARHLVEASAEVAVWNRTRAKTDDLVSAGARVADTIADLTDADVVFVMVATPADLLEVVLGPTGLVSARARPRAVVSCSTVDAATSATVRAALAAEGVGYLAAPISGNPHVVAAGGATFVASGPRATYDLVAPLLDTIARESHWVGEGEEALVVKICHNLYLALIAQSISEVTVLAEKSGVDRRVFLEFLNATGLATPWMERRMSDLLALDWTPTFTSELLRKDVELALDAARGTEVPLPLGAEVHQLLQVAIGRGYRDADFLSLYAVQAASAGLDPEPR
ncbi:MAG: NAD(P)-dependent oxidoreductase [Acidobacteriota bacterium]|nr:NAD(P)-dependent oxidoreductase [Acidobacteriota bacterium]